MDYDILSLEYVNLILKNIKKSGKVGDKLSEYSTAIACIRDIEEIIEIPFNEKTMILELTYDLFGFLENQGYLKEQDNDYKCVKKLDGFKIDSLSLTDDGYSFTLKNNEELDELGE